ncbi:hypothetical protein LINGRAHAP2_LOCUS16725 [Linum grandiflorum]
MIKVEYIYREDNDDLLIYLGHSLYLCVHLVYVSDPAFSLHLLYELFGVSETRLIINER